MVMYAFKSLHAFNRDGTYSDRDRAACWQAADYNTHTQTSDAGRTRKAPSKQSHSDT